MTKRFGWNFPSAGRIRARLIVCLLALFTVITPAYASDGINGAGFGALWAVPFAGMLLSIAIVPMISHHFWEKWQGLVAAFWSLLLIIPLVTLLGWHKTGAALFHTLALDYIPFILLLTALFTTAGGIVIRGNLHGSPLMNCALLIIGALLASVIGTTGASMVMIRPVLRANDNRQHNAHIVIFFIFLVSNIGGALTPLGDPPLFLGFLKGVGFFWTTAHLWLETLVASVIILCLFFALDLYLYRKEGVTRDPTPDSALSFSGLINCVLIACIIGAVLLSASWHPGAAITMFDIEIAGQALLRDTILIVVTFASLLLTPQRDREDNGFEWGPIKEVAILFIGIFATMIPVIAMLKAGASGPFAPLLSLVDGQDGAPNTMAYFWLTGGLSSFLDNAPTYLVFFELAGGDAAHLMTEGKPVLAAISAGAVFMGAMSYIGNAPNFMVYAMARRQGVAMPGFFAYLLWSGAILLPTFGIVTALFF